MVSITKKGEVQYAMNQKEKNLKPSKKECFYEYISYYNLNRRYKQSRYLTRKLNSPIIRQNKNKNTKAVPNIWTLQ